MASKVIAIDGTAYSGKSHIARGLSKITKYEYINTGHMYRALARIALESKIDLNDEKAVSGITLSIRFEKGKTIVSEQNWTDELDDPEIVQAASKVAIFPKVREYLTQMQRKYSLRDFIIMEGRDIGTTVFPDALCKVYVTASPLVRAKRLYKTLGRTETPTDEFIRMLLNEKLIPIDQLDANRKISPLISEEEARKRGYYVHSSPEHYTVDDDVRDIYEKYVELQLKGGIYGTD
ncbi:MAG TPA: (d)CMP kinase [Candidatus Omnitrophica bacterium]|nr:(d)CMP kinase [Candidatus Omnitrophota bacterium]